MKSSQLFLFTSLFILPHWSLSQHDPNLFFPDSVVNVWSEFLNSPERDINNFEVTTFSTFSDSLHSDTDSNKHFTMEVAHDVCLGDLCYSYQKFTNKKSREVVYFFKCDGGDYGFSNSQYMLEKTGELAYARRLSLSVSEFPTDSTNTIWKVEETIVMGAIPEVYWSKIDFIENPAAYDFSMQNIEQIQLSGKTKERSEELLNELKSMLEMETNPYRD